MSSRPRQEQSLFSVTVVMSVGLCQVVVYASTIRLVIIVSAVHVATMAIRYKELRMTADTVRARTKEPARSSWTRQSSVWSVPEDMEVSACDRVLALLPISFALR
jgi:hypothetical protein